VPFGFLKRRRHDSATATPADSGSPGAPATATERGGGSRPGAGTMDSRGIRQGGQRGVGFTALTEDWRLHGRMTITGRLSDALNKREAIAIAGVSWGAPDSDTLVPAPGLKSVDPYDLILVTAGEDSLPPLTETEHAALKVHKVAYEVALEVPPFRILGTVFMHPGSEPGSLLARSTDMFLPVTEAVARLGELTVSEADVDVILVNRFYLRGVEQVDKRTGQPHPKLPGPPSA